MNIIDGKWKEFIKELHVNGSKKMEINYVHGRKEGTETYWHDNGMVQSETQYANGIQRGVSMQWDRNGRQQLGGGKNKGKKNK
ncbi:MAG: hypothetical protein H6554_08910 [Chitinophagales bacterium]|nr:hypothetical protein [Chitinophagales bacterium]